jgi:hypothetical protein
MSMIYFIYLVKFINIPDYKYQVKAFKFWVLLNCMEHVLSYSTLYYFPLIPYEILSPWLIRAGKIELLNNIFFSLLHVCMPHF